MNLPENLQKEYDAHQLLLQSKQDRFMDWSNRDLRYLDLTDANLTRTCLIGSDLSGASLRRANLSEADLRDTNLVWAELSECNLTDAYLQATGNMRELKSLHLDRWIVNIWQDIMQIGCQRHKIEEWFTFSDEEIAEMDTDALEWWKKWSPLLQLACKGDCSDNTNQMA